MSKLIKGNIYQFAKKYFPEVRLDGWLGLLFRAECNLPFESKQDFELWETINNGIPYNHKTFEMPQNVCIVGSRQIGKSLYQGIKLPYNSLTFDLPLIAGSTARNVILCPTVSSGMPVFDFSAALISENEALSKHLVAAQHWQNPIVKNRQQALMRFSNRTTIEIIAPTRLSARGFKVYTLCLDEVAHHNQVEGSRFSDVEVYKSSAPAMATFGSKGTTIMCSTPFDRAGLLWQTYKTFFGRQNPDWLVLQIPIHLGNPDVAKDERYLRQQEESDPQWFKREFLAEFLTDEVNAAFSTEAITDCTFTGRWKLSYNSTNSYFGFIRPAALSQSSSAEFSDEYICGIAHCANEHVVIDVIQGWSAEMNGRRYTPDDALDLSIQLLRSYKVKDVESDKFGSTGLEYKMKDAGFNFSATRLAKSDLFLEFLEILNSGKVELLDDLASINQLKTLQRFRSNTGRDRIANSDRQDGQEKKHDERAQTICGLAHMARSRMNSKPISLNDVHVGRAEPRKDAVFNESITNAADYFREML